MADETKQARLLRIWNTLTPEQRDYDRFVARRIPFGASKAPETEDGVKMRDAMYDSSNDERGCSCHISPPCLVHGTAVRGLMCALCGSGSRFSLCAWCRDMLWACRLWNHDRDTADAHLGRLCWRPAQRATRGQRQALRRAEHHGARAAFLSSYEART